MCSLVTTVSREIRINWLVIVNKTNAAYEFIAIKFWRCEWHTCVYLHFWHTTLIAHIQANKTGHCPTGAFMIFIHTLEHPFPPFILYRKLLKPAHRSHKGKQRQEQSEVQSQLQNITSSNVFWATWQKPKQSNPDFYLSKGNLENLLQ